MKTALRILIVVAAIACSAPALAQQWHWFGPFELFPADSRLSLDGGSPVAAGRFTTTSTGDLQWAYMGLSLTSGATIDSVTVCYQLSSGASYISGIRFARMGTPDVATVVLDLSNDLNNPLPECSTQGVFLTTPAQGMLHLGLRLNFASTSDYIEIGAIGIRVSPAPTAIGEDQNSRAPGPRLLGQNTPNPFNPGTRIAFELPNDQHVELDIYTIAGDLVATLIDGIETVGRHEVAWNGRDSRGRAQASGVYLYRLKTGERTETRQMTLIR